MDLRYHAPLSPEEQTAHGLPEPWPLAMADRVRFCELDMLRHVNNATYMAWFETIRIRYFQDWGLSQYRAEDPRIVIRRAEIDYFAEMVMDESYIVTARCGSFRRTSFTLLNEIWAGGTRRAGFSCVIVTLEPDGSAKRALPQALITRFREVDGAQPAG
ncbi:acyl-CoA thioesterase [Rhodosalinus sp. FB01]|uniref:acyl-CoA thioesterase n=1 Tax=Rhodosalinus sp. FB01 TaxID=3239194 RepID=UPI00352491F1